MAEKTEKCETLPTGMTFSSKTHDDIPPALSKAEKYLDKKRPNAHMVNGIKST